MRVAGAGGWDAVLGGEVNVIARKCQGAPKNLLN